ncbi:rho GTPase-activating protein 7-like [Pollicipes pollicipes]|uniref:rho GTPase-activating protein 7-like n=1 Tax=Pollicipes pollicipes TaxID=41117 RepID=UPI0018849ED3|nr:rho GTPase-activating protein 7-like [Pollicipes pollicipes]
MLKQYLRELPEVLATNRVSQILIAIYQYAPAGLRPELARSALLLLPDESRLALQTLLSFLAEVAAAADVNQMTAHNLAVCLAPTLLSMTSQRSASVSPRRTRRAGLPDQRELDENKAAHECLTALIRQAESLFRVPAGLLALCRFSALDVSQPVGLSELGTEEQPRSWRAYWRLVERLAEDAEVLQYVEAAAGPRPTVQYCVLRAWRTDLPRGACCLVETSVEHPDAPAAASSRRGVVLASRYLVEPCGAGKSRLTHYSRVEQGGCSPEWYSRVYGHECARVLAALRASFRHEADGPESRV